MTIAEVGRMFDLLGQGMSQADVAKALGVTEGTVSRRVKKARERQAARKAKRRES